MSFSRSTLDEIISRVSSDFKAAFGATYIALRSFIQIFARVIGGAVHLVYGYIDNIVNELFILTATTTFLERLGAEYGILRNAAIASAGTITITGTAGTIIPIDTELQSVSDNNYTTDAQATIGVGGSIAVDITAVTAGANSNEAAGAILTFITPIPTVDTSAIVDGDALIGGTDEEEDEDYRSRILIRKRFAPHSGNEQDYINWAKEVSGVTRAWVYPQYQGRGTLAVYFMRDDDVDPFPDATAVAVVRAYIISHTDSRGVVVGAPVTAEPGLFVIAPVAKVIDLSISIFPNTADVQTQVEAELEDLFFREGGPAKTIRLSQVDEAISLAEDEEYHNLTVPASDIVMVFNEVAVLGTITWSDY